MCKVLREMKGPVSFTRLGIKYEVRKVKGEVERMKEEVKSLIENPPPLKINIPGWTEYGCGCKKVEGKFLCGKHQRV